MQMSRNNAARAYICGKFHRKFYRCSTATTTNLYHCCAGFLQNPTGPKREIEHSIFLFALNWSLCRCHNTEAAFLTAVALKLFTLIQV